MDFISDQSGRHLLRLNLVLGDKVPGYVKESSVVQEDVAGLPDSLFAISHLREFPVDTPGHVFLSYGYAKSAGVKSDDLMQKILKAASFFAIESDLRLIDDAFESLTKTASAGKRYAISIDFGTADPNSENPGVKLGGVRGFYPIDDAMQTEKSAVKLANDRSKLPLEVFAEGCRAVVKAACEQQLPAGILPRVIQDYGVERLPQAEFLEHMAGQRKAATNDDIYGEIAKAAVANEDSKATHEWAELWIQADRQNGYKAASKDEPDPFMIFNSGPTVEAMERQIESWTVINGAAVPVAKVAAVKEADLQRKFGAEPGKQLNLIVKKAAAGAKGSELIADFEKLDKGARSVFLKHLAVA